jgi:hypothetical protein
LVWVCGSGLDKEEQNPQLITRQIEYSTCIYIYKHWREDPTSHDLILEQQSKRSCLLSIIYFENPPACQQSLYRENGAYFSILNIPFILYFLGLDCENKSKGFFKCKTPILFFTYNLWIVATYIWKLWLTFTRVLVIRNYINNLITEQDWNLISIYPLYNWYIWSNSTSKYKNDYFFLFFLWVCGYSQEPSHIKEYVNSRSQRSNTYMWV